MPESVEVSTNAESKIIIYSMKKYTITVAAVLLIVGKQSLPILFRYMQREQSI
jgi:hypothetical protein